MKTINDSQNDEAEWDEATTEPTNNYEENQLSEGSPQIKILPINESEDESNPDLNDNDLRLDNSKADDLLKNAILNPECTILFRAVLLHISDEEPFNKLRDHIIGNLKITRDKAEQNKKIFENILVEQGNPLLKEIISSRKLIDFKNKFPSPTYLNDEDWMTDKTLIGNNGYLASPDGVIIRHIHHACKEAFDPSTTFTTIKQTIRDKYRSIFTLMLNKLYGKPKVSRNEKEEDHIVKKRKKNNMKTTTNDKKNGNSLEVSTIKTTSSSSDSKKKKLKTNIFEMNDGKDSDVIPLTLTLIDYIRLRKLFW
jgi:hypothetical protein